MKKLALVTIALASLAGFANAADTQTVTVNATVLNTCKFTTAAQTVTFADIDPSATTDRTAPLTVSYRCTKGATPVAIVVSTVAGDTVPLTKGAETMAFTVDVFTGIVNGNGFAQAATAATSTIRILPGQFQDKTAGLYTGSFKVNITP